MSENDMAVIQPTAVERQDALLAAREVLLVKAGKYAERALDAFDLITLAEFILGGHDSVTLSAAEFERSVEVVRERLFDATDGALHLVRGEE
ncbi:hypothetical protein [Aeromicrobium sp. WCS2018Hpa-33]|nr:hypothetical protein [Aeromicrobium sp. WCS2018Hpa-33]